MRRGRLVSLVRQFVEAESWSASRLILEQQTALDSDDAEAILRDLQAAAQGQDDDVAASRFETHRRLLRSYRDVGVAAFDDLIAPEVPEPLRRRWVDAEIAYERFRAAASRATADAAVLELTGVLRDDLFREVPPAFRAGMHQAAGTVLAERYQRFGGPLSDLDAAAGCYARAWHDLPLGSPDRPSYASALGNVLGLRFERRGDPADIKTAVAWSREAVSATPKGERWWLLHNLSINLAACHEILGSPDDLNEAIDTARDALASDPPRDRSAALVSNLAGLLHDRFERDGSIDDLRAALALQADLDVAGRPEERAALMVTFAVAHRSLAERLDAPADEFDAAIKLLKDAANALGSRSPYWATVLGILGDTYFVRFERSGPDASKTDASKLGAEDLVAATKAYVRALRRADPRAPRTALLRCGLAMAELALGDAVLDTVGTNRAIQHLEAAANVVSRAPRLRPFVLSNLARGRRVRYNRSAGSTDPESVGTAYQDACRAGLECDLEIALESAGEWASWAASRSSWDESCTAYEIAFQALDRLSSNQVGSAEKEVWLVGVQGIGARAAYAAVKGSMREQAVVFLERGRARLLAENLRLSELEVARLAVGDPTLARRFVEAAGRMRSLDILARDERSGRPFVREQLVGHAG
jgi:tetratricopeptide (TPR) repeat protein